jgi:hypothetical protein
MKKLAISVAGTEELFNFQVVDPGTESANRSV